MLFYDPLSENRTNGPSNFSSRAVGRRTGKSDRARKNTQASHELSRSQVLASVAQDLQRLMDASRPPSKRQK